MTSARPSDVKAVAFAEALSLGAVPFLVAGKGRIAKVVVFGKARGSAAAALLLRTAGVACENAETHLADVTDASGRSLFQEVYADASRICGYVRRDEFETSASLKAACELLGGRDAILLYLEKCLFEDVFKAVAQARMAKWRFDSLPAGAASGCVLFLPDGPWWKHLSEYCRSLGIEAVRAGAGPRSRFRRISRNNIFSPAFFVKRAVLGLFAARPAPSPAVPAGDKARIATEYLGTPVSLDPDRRSTFPWLVQSGIPEDRVALIRSNDAFRISEEERELLRKKRIRLLSPSKASTALRLLRDGKFLRSAARLLGAWAASGDSWYLADKLLMYAVFYAYWLDVFRRHGVRLIMTTAFCDPFHVPMNRALRDSGGISMAYQWSNIELDSKLLGLYCDVYFGFSEMYKDIFAKHGSLIGTFVPSGYVTDYTFRKVKSGAEGLRGSLAAKGAEFVVSFFDESSSDDLYSVITHDRNIRVYKYFLEKVISDRTLGVIFKPSYPHDIHQRLAPLAALIEKAKATGRCVFVDKGQFKSDMMPSEAAQASDLAVALLVAGTVALESSLSGVRTAFLNIEKLPSRGLGPQDRGSTVFESLDDLFAGIERFRKGQHRGNDFGDLSRWAALRDGHRDGQATDRIGRTVNSLLEALDRGEDRETALRNAARAGLAQPVGGRVA